MTGFVLAAVIMLGVALAFVLVPLLKQRSATGAGVEETNVAVFRAQKREIEDDFAGGRIDATERDAALAELTRRVAEEIPVAGAAASRRDERAWPVIVVLAAVLPVTAAGLYLALGSLNGLKLDAMSQMAAAPAAGATTGGADDDTPGAGNIPDAKIVEMVDTLARKMEQNPSDPKGWMLLARSQAALGRLPEAMKAYEKASALLPGDVQLLADYADVAAMAQQGRFEGKPWSLIDKALKIDPSHPKALVLAATAELKGPNPKASLVHWEKLRSVLPKESEDHRQVEQIIADVKAGKTDFLRAGNEPPASPPGASAPPSRATPSPSAATGAASANAGVAPAKAGAGSAKVSGTIVLAKDLAAKVGANDILFVFARAKEGPRMPLAVLRVPARASEFPRAFELTDTMAMAPGMSLSSFPEVVIEARVSKSGNAQLSPGDLVGTSGAIKSTTAGLTVTIDKVAP